MNAAPMAANHDGARRHGAVRSVLVFDSWPAAISGRFQLTGGKLAWQSVGSSCPGGGQSLI